LPLEGVRPPVVLTSTTVVRDELTGERERTCADTWPDRRPSAPAVVRVGTLGESVTFRDASGQFVLGCDNTEGERESGRRWCGGAFGTLHGGRLLDPRLDLLCVDAEGAPLAFAWVEPAPGTRFVVVDQNGYAEAYEVAGSLPVRVASKERVDLATSSAILEITEHDREGTLLRRYSVDARVAG
jgi:hypothetical protein